VVSVAADDPPAAAPEVDGALVVKRRTRLALGTMLVLLAGIVAVALVAAEQLYESAQHRYVKEAFPLRAAARQIIVDMLDEETGVRGYLITSDPSTLTPYESGRERVASDLTRLRELSASRPEIEREVRTLGQIVFELDQYFAHQVALVEKGRTGQLTAQANVLVGTSRFDRFRQTASLLDARAGQIVRGAERRQRRTFWSTIAFVVALGAAAGAVGIFLLLRLPPLVERLYLREEDARRRAEQGDRASRSLAHVAEAVILLDTDDVVRYWNAAAERKFDFSEGEAIGRKLTDVAPELALAGERLERDGAATVAVPVGDTSSWFAVTDSRFVDGRVLVLRDVTAERALERARSDFVATASHELRTPLAAVYGAVRTLLRHDRKPDPEQDRLLLEMIEEESEQLKSIVEQILDTSQLDRGRVRVDRRVCELRDLGERVLASARIRASSAHTLTLDAPAEVLVEADPERLRQVLANLVDNALKYAPDGGRIELRIREDDVRVTIDVADEGIGIRPEVQPLVFEKFYRADADMRSGVGGSGLGLYISRELVRQMGGELGVRSVPGAGSTFTIELPRVDVKAHVLATHRFPAT